MAEHKQRRQEVSELPDPTEISEGEFAKSKATRTRILEAAIHCLAESGYVATSTNAVAVQAGITRAALLYHFPSRAALIEAVIHYVTRRRVEMQEAGHRDIPRDENFPTRSIQVFQQQLTTPEFWAFCELATASRSNRSLGRVFKPAMEAFDRARREMALRIAQDRIVDAPGFDLRRDITRFLLEGIALQDGITFNREKRSAELMAFLSLLYQDDRFLPLLADAETMAADARPGS